MSTKTRATIEDLYKVEGKAELVNGEIVEMPPAGDEPGAARLEIVVSLRDYARRTGRGRAYPDGTGFHVHLHRQSRVASWAPRRSRTKPHPWSSTKSPGMSAKPSRKPSCCAAPG
jgi:Uma2 family endonuclease